MYAKSIITRLTLLSFMMVMVTEIAQAQYQIRTTVDNKTDLPYVRAKVQKTKKQPYVRVTIKNTMRQPVEMVSIDPYKNTRKSFHIAPRQRIRLEVKANHRWNFRLDGQRIATYKATRNRNQSFEIQQPRRDRSYEEEPYVREDYRQKKNRRPRRVTFRNDTERPMRVVQINPRTGRNQYVERIPACSAITLTASPGDVFRFKQRRHTIDSYRVTKFKRQAYTIRSSYSSRRDRLDRTYSWNIGRRGW